MCLAAGKEISFDATALAVLSEVESFFTLKEEQGRLSSVEKMLVLARVSLPWGGDVRLMSPFAPIGCPELV